MRIRYSLVSSGQPSSASRTTVQRRLRQRPGMSPEDFFRAGL